MYKWGGDIIFENITLKEESLIKTISKTGFFFEMYLTNLNMSTKIIYSCIKKGFIVRERPVFIFSNLTTPYSLTEKGKELASNRYSISPYRTSINQAEHDYVLGSIYTSLSQDEQSSWETETSLLVRYPGQSVVDAIYIDSFNNIVGVEVITDDYSEDEINAKLHFIKNYCDKKIIIYTKDI